MKRNCPCCDGKNSIGKFQQHFLNGPLCDGYVVSVCNTCGFVFADSIPGEEEFESYYEQRSKYTYPERSGLESPHDFRRFEQICDQVSPYLTAPQPSILDIGCATGGLLVCWRKRGVRHVMGMDPSRHCASLAKQLHDIDVTSAPISELIRDKFRFDLISLVGVLEHVYHPKSLLQSLLRLLKPGGLIYAGQPNLDTFHLCRNAPFQQFSTEHINFFTPRSLASMMNRCGYSPVCLWEWMVEWRANMTDSMTSGLFATCTDSLPNSAPDHYGAIALDVYISKCRLEEERVRVKVEALITSREPIIVWGAGTMTRRLLATTNLSDANIVCFVDNDRRYCGQSLAGKEIRLPSAVDIPAASFVVGSVANQVEIVAEIYERFGSGQNIILLYQ